MTATRRRRRRRIALIVVCGAIAWATLPTWLAVSGGMAIGGTAAYITAHRSWWRFRGWLHRTTHPAETVRAELARNRRAAYRRAPNGEFRGSR